MRWQCTECDWIGETHEIDRVDDPKPDSNMRWSVCPDCRSAESFKNLCDEPGCNKEATCGWPSENNYRRTCYWHSQFNDSYGDAK